MTALPPIADFTGPNITEGEFKTALANLHLFLSGLLGTTGQAADAQAALGALLGAGAVTQTGAYTVQITDRGRVIACSGTFTVTLPDAVAVGSGFAVAVGNYGDGTITIDPFSTQTLDGAATRTLSPNRMMVVCAINGEWLSVGGIGAASTSEAGVVKLVDSYTSTSLTEAPTANALKAGVDAAVTVANSRAPAEHTHNYVPVDSNRGVGCFAYLKVYYSTGVAAGASLAGTYLGYPDNSVAVGTWRSQCFVANQTSAIFQRIA